MKRKISVVVTESLLFQVRSMEVLKGTGQRIEVLKVVGSWKELIDQYSQVQPDVVVLDMDQPDLNALEVIRRLIKYFPSARVLCCSHYKEKELVTAAAKTGVKGYVVKSSGSEDFLEGIRKVAAGERYYAPEVTRELVENSGLLKFCNGNSNVKLTRREEQVLKMIVDGKSSREIGEKLFISTRTVDTHRTNLMRKLDIRNIAALIRYGLEQGYARN